MNSTRRGFFSWIGGVAAGLGIVAAKPDVVTFPETLLSRFQKAAQGKPFAIASVSIDRAAIADKTNTTFNWNDHDLEVIYRLRDGHMGVLARGVNPEDLAYYPDEKIARVIESIDLAAVNRMSDHPSLRGYRQLWSD